MENRVASGLARRVNTEVPEWIGRVVVESSLAWTGSFEIMAKTLAVLNSQTWVILPFRSTLVLERTPCV